MKTILTVIFWLTALALCQAQSEFYKMPFGKVTTADLEMTTYAKDTSASAVYLDEMGKAYISDRENEDLIFDRYVKIKILKQEGVEQANFALRLYKLSATSKQDLLSVTAVTYNLDNGVRKEIKLDQKSIFRENSSERTDYMKFTLPDVRVGSVIEVSYKLNTPFYSNFWPWEFQGAIPKVHSEYWTLIPGNYVYNITLRGGLRLKKKEDGLVDNCFTPGGGAKAQCASAKYAMDDVPALIEEDYMTSAKNFISSLHFELAELKLFDGTTKKYAREWKDVDLELKSYEGFGDQLKKVKGVMGDQIKTLVSGEPDTLRKAKIVYDFIRKKYEWNDYNGMYTMYGVKKAFDIGKGNIGDINLSLIGALQLAGVNAFPVILSTRSNGTPTVLHPVTSELNYVIGYAMIGGTPYFLDATQKDLPFGTIPMECLNGKGRLMTKESSWIDIKSRDKYKRTANIELAMKDGFFEGTFIINHHGYYALDKRQEINGYLAKGDGKDLADYKKALQTSWKDIEITGYEMKGLDSLERPLEERVSVKIPIDNAAKTVFFNPFIFDRITKNPFHSTERLYPVDFGAPVERLLTLNLTIPDTYEVDEYPTPTGLVIPQNGGRMLFNATVLGNRVNITSNLTFNKAVYGPGEYGTLKEVYNRLVQINQSQIVLKKK